MTFDGCETVEDRNVVDRSRLLVKSVIRGGYEVDKHWLAQRRWYVVPVESADHFDEAALRRLARIGAESSCYLTITDDPADASSVFRCSGDFTSWRRCNEALAPFSVLIAPAGQEWFIYCTKCDFYLVAGALQQVERICGVSVAQAENAYRASAEDWVKPRDRAFHLAVLASCHEQNVRAAQSVIRG